MDLITLDPEPPFLIEADLSDRDRCFIIAFYYVTFSHKKEN